MTNFAATMGVVSQNSFGVTEILIVHMTLATSSTATKRAAPVRHGVHKVRYRALLAEDVSQGRGSVMETWIVKMELMKVLIVSLYNIMLKQPCIS